MKKLLFEIGTAEMPAQYMDGILSQYKELAENKLTEARIPFASVKVYGTPRRMAFLVNDLADTQKDSTEEYKGPALKIAFDAEGKPSKAAQGFARGKGVDVSTLEQRDGYVYAVKHLKGQPTLELLPALLDNIIHSMNFPKTMRWADYEFGFVRPIRWMVALLDSTVIPVEVNDVKSSNETWGHRVLSNKFVAVPTAGDYEQVLIDNFVIADVDKRRAMIKEEVEEAAKKEGGKAVIEPGLLEEVTYLVEYPTALCGHIDEKYLRLPEPAIITPMRDHQRYFPMVDATGKLMAKFITVRNGGKEHLDIVAHGNERVLRARLDDAVFFFDNDRKKTLEQHREALKDVSFQRGLGNMYEKTERLAGAAKALHYALQAKSNVEDLERAARLCKADLVTGMVIEFTELQGVMGKEYALLDGEKPEVAQDIFEHYLPRFAGDVLPQSENGRILAIVDKIDNITATFSRGEAPTGSQDPFALRRQALGILNIILEGKMHVPMMKLVGSALYLLKIETNKTAKLIKEVLEFIKLRLKNMLTDQGIRYDVIDAVMADERNTDMYDIYLRTLALNAYVETAEAKELIQAGTRVCNICKNASTEAEVKPELFNTPEEKELYTVVKEVDEKVFPLAARFKYDEYLKALTPLTPVINKFFDAVMIMDKDEAVKNNRLALVQDVKKLLNGVGDISVLVMA
ncbi:MAG: glycine--tRNA ligase subunit beta [Acidaminococcaceae bacterium]|nr:glycine--tRNA ligase subunit beta [Acidaminococcaceae bacterium]